MSFADPQSNVLQMGLSEGMRVADFGAGSGHYAFAASAIVGGNGKVYAVDVQQDILTRLKDEAHRRHIRNIETVWGNLEKPGGTKLREQSVDAVILSNTLFQIEHKEGAAAEVRRVLKPGGKLLVIDWDGAYGGLGPSGEHVVSESSAEALFAGAGFRKVKAFRGGPHHYALLFTAP